VRRKFSGIVLIAGPFSACLTLFVLSGVQSELLLSLTLMSGFWMVAVPFLIIGGARPDDMERWP
jgi:hypothetical protein